MLFILSASLAASPPAFAASKKSAAKTAAAAKEYGDKPTNYVVGANIAGFLKVADAMMAQLKLSSFPEIQLVARISRSGVATQGEWVGRGQPIASSTRDAQTLLIDSPEQAQ